MNECQQMFSKSRHGGGNDNGVPLHRHEARKLHRHLERRAGEACHCIELLCGMAGCENHDRHSRGSFVGGRISHGSVSVDDVLLLTAQSGYSLRYSLVTDGSGTYYVAPHCLPFTPIEMLQTRPARGPAHVNR